MVEHQLRSSRSPFVGSPLTVANEIQRWFDGGGFDGINVSVTVPSEFALFTGKVLPILRERGVVRREYESATLRGNLGLPIPENRHTAARRTGGSGTENTDAFTSPASPPFTPQRPVRA